MADETTSSQEAAAEFVAEVPQDFDGGRTWRFQCPACEATFDTDNDARDTEVACEHCTWKGKAGK
jgi:hypothetical protein